MKPLDPRLLRTARSARVVLGVGGVLGFVRALAMLAWSWFLALALAAVAVPAIGASGRIAQGAPDAEQLPALLACAAAAALVRAACTWGMESVAARGAVRVKSELRGTALDALDGLAARGGRGAAAFAGDGDTGRATALGRGLDALDGYFSGYLPQLILTAVATPLLVLAVFVADRLSGIIVLLVFPLIPIFMVLIGLATQAVQNRQWQQLKRLSASFLDVVAGLATLRIFGRERRQTARIAREAEEYRSRTMRVLRVTFLSGFVLDLAGTLSIALVAVTVGTKLVDGRFPLALALFVLLLMPEVFIPIRQVGAAFHASAEGLAAAEDVFALIESGRAAGAKQGRAARAIVPGSQDPARTAGLRFDGVAVDRGGETVVGPVSFGVGRGEIVALVGPSGAGKSTLLAAVLGFVEPSAGSLLVDGEVAWAGQRPELLQGSVAENVALGDVRPDPALVRRALDAVLLEDLDAELGIGAGGSGVSGGQAQRIAIARALYRAWARDAAILLLDEPSSALDARSEGGICRVMRAEADAGRAVLVVTHRDRVSATADRVVRVEPAKTRAASLEASS